jgi:hypothetical protein
MTQSASGFQAVQASFQKLHRAMDGDQWSVVGSAMNCSSAAETDYGFALRDIYSNTGRMPTRKANYRRSHPPVRQRAIQAARSQYIATFDPSSPVFVRVVYNFEAEHSMRLSFHQGDPTWSSGFQSVAGGMELSTMFVAGSQAIIARWS